MALDKQQQGVLMINTGLAPAQAKERQSTRRRGIRRMFFEQVLTRCVGLFIGLPMVVALCFAWAIAKYLGAKPAVVFAVYGTALDRRWVIGFERFRRFLPRIVPIGIIRFRGSWGLIGATFYLTAEEMSSSDTNARERVAHKAAAELPHILNAFPGVGAVALAGRWPGLIIRAQRRIEHPFVDGCYGTRATMVKAALAAVAKLPDPPRSSHDLTVAVLGARGRIGSPLVRDLAVHFRRVVAIDPDGGSGPAIQAGGKVVAATSPAAVASAQIVICLMAEGDQIATTIPYLATGAVVVDDTHPPIHRPLRLAIKAGGSHLYKVVMVDGELRMFPPLPNFRADNIPGCLLEAMVQSLRGREIATDFSALLEAVDELGCRAELIEHRNHS